MREADPARDEPYHYTYLIDLKKIMAKNWGIFEEDFARLRNVFSNSLAKSGLAPTEQCEGKPVLDLFKKNQFLELLDRINDVRNRHAHPVRAPDPDSDEYSNDLRLAGMLENIIDGVVALSRHEGP
jgi:hypothetical protein